MLPTLPPGTEAEPRIEDRLLASIGQWRDSNPAGKSGHLVRELRAIESHRPVIEQAKGVLALRYGIDSHQAFAMMVRWSRTVHAPVHAIAHTLMRGICGDNPETTYRQRPLTLWLEEQLRDNDSYSARSPIAPVWSAPGTEDSATSRGGERGG